MTVTVVDRTGRRFEVEDSSADAWVERGYRREAQAKPASKKAAAKKSAAKK